MKVKIFEFDLQYNEIGRVEKMINDFLKGKRVGYVVQSSAGADGVPPGDEDVSTMMFTTLTIFYEEVE